MEKEILVLILEGESAKKALDGEWTAAYKFDESERKEVTDALDKIQDKPSNFAD